MVLSVDIDMRMGATWVTHNLVEDTVTVTRCREPGCSVSVNYDIPMKQVEALILLSGGCEQYVRYQCKIF